MRRAAFLDRDGTLIVDAHYLADAARVHVVPGAIDAVRTLRAAGIVPVIVTNQSGIARGHLDDATYQQIRRRVEQLFAEAGAGVLATYHCPHHPDVTGPCRCRKPGTGMFEQAIADHDLDAARSLFAGDRRRDVEPALTLGGFGVLVPSPDTPEDDLVWAEREAQVASSLEEAVTRYLDWIAR
ncbi:MAG: HAD family hydrolase [Gemmatimonadetes bacterium]|nr:HAD family hydrolase [Gemmatimonadota bacterium]